MSTIISNCEESLKVFDGVEQVLKIDGSVGPELNRHRQHGSHRALTFVGSPIDLYQCFTLHLQLYLRILLEDLRVALAEHRSYPLIGSPPALSRVA
jgi:hypothetical protein